MRLPIKSDIEDWCESIDGYHQHCVVRECLSKYGELTDLPIEDSINEVRSGFTKQVDCAYYNHLNLIQAQNLDFIGMGHGTPILSDD